MKDKNLERKIESLNQLIDLWLMFKTFLQPLFPQEVTPEKEEEFLYLKSIIAQKVENLTSKLEGRFPEGGQINKIVSYSTSLKEIIGESGLQLSKLLNDWHVFYIALNRVLGGLENKKRQLAEINVFLEGVGKLVKHPVTVFIFVLLVNGLYFTGLLNFFFLQEDAMSSVARVYFSTQEV